MSPSVDPSGLGENHLPGPLTEPIEPVSTPVSEPTESWQDNVGGLIFSFWGRLGDFFVSEAAAAPPSSQPDVLSGADRTVPTSTGPVRVDNDQRYSSLNIDRLVEQARSCGRNRIRELAAGPTAEFPQSSAPERIAAFRNAAATIEPGINYYLNRALDFAYRNPDRRLPDYYLNYGNKYARRFLYETSLDLSEQGRLWLGRTFVNLQESMNERIRTEGATSFAALERDDEAFTEYAYGTHTGAYLEGGLLNLAGDWQVGDLYHIVMTPDVGDLATWDGLGQVVQIAPRVMWAMTGLE